jgi:hypothetical protein
MTRSSKRPLFTATIGLVAAGLSAWARRSGARDFSVASRWARALSHRIQTAASASVAQQSTATPESGIEPFGNDDSVAQCLMIINEVANEQRGRNRHLDTKAGSIAGFSATALTLNLTLGRPLLLQPFRASGSAHGVIRDAFIASAALFAAAVLAAVVGVLRPTGTHDLDETAIDAYADRPKVITAPSKLRETWLQTLTAMALSDRKAGNTKARWSNVGVVLLALGILGLLVQAITLGIAS